MHFIEKYDKIKKIFYITRVFTDLIMNSWAVLISSLKLECSKNI